MAALAPGILQKLVEGMKTGIKPTREHRSSLLQVTDIVPIDLDEKNLVPKQGFLIKVTDSSHSIYVTLPPDQEEDVLSNKMQLGQFIYVDRLEPGSPVPIIKGAKPIPGRHPLLGTPELLIGPKGKSGQEPGSKPRRGSWGQNVVSSPFVLKPMPLDFDSSTPEKRPVSARLAASPIRRVGVRCSLGGGVLGNMVAESPGMAMLRKSCVVPSALKFPRSRSVCVREAKRNNNASASDLSPFKSSREVQEEVIPLSTSKKISIREESQKIELIKPEKNTNLLGRLNTLSKEATQLQETTQKIALQALREATITDSVMRNLKMFTNLSRSAKTDCPAVCFEKFMEFHNEMAQTITEITSIDAAALDAENKSQNINTITEDHKPREEENSSILNEIAYNSIDQEKKRSKRRIILKQQSEEKILRSNDENENPACGRIGNTIRLAKEIEDEATNWFMEFIEMALEKGMKKSKVPDDADVKKVPQSLILRVINWIEVEQSNNNNNKRQAIHPNASKITRKLRIKLKNP